MVLDNVGAHMTAHVHRIVDAAGARVLLLPPHFPTSTPSNSPGASQGAPQDVAARTQAALDDAIRIALDGVAHVDRVPEEDGVGDEVQATGLVGEPVIAARIKRRTGRQEAAGS